MILVPAKSPQTTGNDQHVTPLTRNMKTGGMWFTFPQLAGDANVTFLNPSLELSFAIERASPSPWQNDFISKENYTTQRKWHNGKLQLQHENKGIMLCFLKKWGGRQTFQMLSRQRREIQSTAHSQLAKSGKERVDCISRSASVIIISVISSSRLREECW